MGPQRAGRLRTKGDETVSDDLQPPPSSCNKHWKVQVAKHDVRRHSGASFAAQSSGSTLDCKSPSPQHPSSGTRSSMMAKGVEKTATTDRYAERGERNTETAQDHPEKVGSMRVSWKGWQKKPCQPWARSGSATRLVRALQGVPSSDCG